MDSFSDKFQYYLDLKGLKIADVQRFSGLNLTTLYKMLDGSRAPTKLEVVEKIAESLCLNSEEREDLIESYYLTRLGPIGYYGRREVRKFYNNVNRRPVEESVPFLPFKTIPLESGENMVLKGNRMSTSRSSILSTRQPRIILVLPSTLRNYLKITLCCL